MACVEDNTFHKLLRVSKLYTDRLTCEDQDLVQNWIAAIRRSAPEEEENRNALMVFLLKKLRCGAIPKAFQCLSPSDGLPTIDQVLDMETQSSEDQCTATSESAEEGCEESTSGRGCTDDTLPEEEYESDTCDVKTQCSSIPGSVDECDEEEEEASENTGELDQKERDLVQELMELGELNDELPSCLQLQDDEQKIDSSMPAGLEETGNDENESDEPFDVLDFFEKHKDDVMGQETLLLQILDNEIKRAAAIMKTFTEKKLVLYKEAVNEIVRDTQEKYSDLLENYKQEAEETVDRVTESYPFFDRELWQNYMEDPKTIYDPFKKKEEDLYVLDCEEKKQIQDNEAYQKRLIKEFKTLKHDELMKQTRNAEGKRRLKGYSCQDNQASMSQTSVGCPTVSAKTRLEKICPY